MDLTNVTCTCRVPQLQHMPCSHLITACRIRGVDHTSPAYLATVYSKYSVLKTWESRFEPILDPSQWPDYTGPEYVPDSSMKRTKVGRRKKRRFRNEMDDCNGYGDDMYGYGDFNEDPSTVICSVCGETGHRMERHKEGPKNRPKNWKENRGVALAARAGYDCIYSLSNYLVKLVRTILSNSLLFISSCLLFLFRDMAPHPDFPLLDLSYDQKHRAHLMVDGNEVIKRRIQFTQCFTF